MDGKRKKKKHFTCREEPHRQSNDPPFIPMDVWAEILLRIPAEDLVKLKIVCKCWYELITSQSFARTHLDHWTASRPPFSGFAVHTNCSINGFKTSSILYFTVHLDCKGGRFRCHDFLIPYCHCCLSMEYRLLASCEGLLLIGYAKEDRYLLVICNPITGTYRRLPIFQPSDGSFSWPFSESISKDYEWAMVHNASTGQYKVFGMQTRPNPQRTCRVFELQRYGREEHSMLNWKEVDAPLPMEWMIESSTAREEKVHWFARTRDPVKVKILSINVLTDEVWVSASIQVLPRLNLCRMWNGTYYCIQWWPRELRLWALENFDNPKWVEKSRSICHVPAWPSSLWPEKFDMPGGIKLVIKHNSWNYNVMLEATEAGCSSYLINWNAEKVVHHVNSLIGFH